jgi:hypothetical protein
VAHLVHDPTTVSLLFLAFALALAFEAVNGCHDTSNAVATIIYTRWACCSAAPRSPSRSCTCCR